MGTLTDPSENELVRWADFLNSSPDNVRVVAERFPPWHLYRMRSTGHRVQIYSFDEMGQSRGVTLTVVVLREFNPQMGGPDRRVFGIEPDDLEVCEKL